MADVRILTREEILRRLARLKGKKHVPRMADITLQDLAKWMGVSRRCVRGHMAGAFPINEAHQHTYSVFFSLLDAGCLKVTLAGKKKVIERVAPPKEAPRREMRPFIDLTTMRLKLE